MSTPKKIVITGPESSGKTTLSRALAQHFASPWIPEYAREFLAQLDRPYVEEDLLTIARGQVALEDQAAPEADPLLFCDTGLEVIRLWSLVKYGRVDPGIEQLLLERDYTAYLLCAPDFAWEPDLLRETPDPEKRWQLFRLYEKELQHSGVPWRVISGREAKRLPAAIAAVQILLS